MSGQIMEASDVNPIVLGPVPSGGVVTDRGPDKRRPAMPVTALGQRSSLPQGQQEMTAAEPELSGPKVVVRVSQAGWQQRPHGTQGWR